MIPPIYDPTNFSSALAATACEPTPVDPVSRTPRTDRLVIRQADGSEWVDALHCREMELEVAKARLERDLAVAHDTQPYPTVAAYEAACHTLRVRRDEIDALTLLLKRVELLLSVEFTFRRHSPNWQHFEGVKIYEDVKAAIA